MDTYKFENMFNIQKLAFLINGYKPDETCACEDAYFECETKEKKLEFIQQLSNTYEGVMPITMLEAKRLYEYLEAEGIGEDGWFHAFSCLGDYNDN